MRYVTVEVDIEHGRISAREPEKLPEKAVGLLTILPEVKVNPPPERRRVEVPLISGDGIHKINPTPQDLDASLWGD